MEQLITYIDISAVSVGVPSTFAFYLVSLVNAGSAVGRLLGGVVADRIGMSTTLLYLIPRDCMLKRKISVHHYRLNRRRGQCRRTSVPCRCDHDFPVALC